MGGRPGHRGLTSSCCLRARVQHWETPHTSAWLSENRIPHNPMTDVSLPTVTDLDDIYLTPAQVGPQFRALVWLRCYAGPRIGELLALRWSGVDVLHRTVTI